MDAVTTTVAISTTRVSGSDGSTSNSDILSSNTLVLVIAAFAFVFCTIIVVVIVCVCGLNRRKELEIKEKQIKLEMMNKQTSNLNSNSKPLSVDKLRSLSNSLDKVNLRATAGAGGAAGAHGGVGRSAHGGANMINVDANGASSQGEHGMSHLDRHMDSNHDHVEGADIEKLFTTTDDGSKQINVMQTRGNGETNDNNINGEDESKSYEE